MAIGPLGRGGKWLARGIEQFERLDAEKKDLAEQQKEVMAEAKSRGYDTKVIRKVIALRKRDKDDIAEEHLANREKLNLV